jgi:hypothetical protein
VSYDDRSEGHDSTITASDDDGTESNDVPTSSDDTEMVLTINFNVIFIPLCNSIICILVFNNNVYNVSVYFCEFSVRHIS